MANEALSLQKKKLCIGSGGFKGFCASG